MYLKNLYYKKNFKAFKNVTIHYNSTYECFDRSQ